MIKHIVWWTLQEEAENASASENALKIKEMAEALVNVIDEAISIEVSVKPQSTTTVEAQVILQSVHNSMEGLKAYSDHPEHQKLGAFIKKVATSRNAIDYEI